MTDDIIEGQWGDMTVADAVLDPDGRLLFHESDPRDRPDDSRLDSFADESR